MDIKLYQFGRLLGLPSPSPFCMKLETYLRMAGFEYELGDIGAGIRSPTGKLPYIELDGKLLNDSGLIIDHLEHHFGRRVDGKLSAAQRGLSLAWQRTLEDHLACVLVYARWLDPDHIAEINAFLGTALGASGPSGEARISGMRSDIRNALHYQGIGRHDPETIWRLGIGDVSALSDWLAVRPFAFGDEPSVVDACIFSNIGSIIRIPWSNPLTEAAARCENLVAHFDRMMSRYFPDLVDTTVETPWNETVN